MARRRRPRSERSGRRAVRRLLPALIAAATALALPPTGASGAVTFVGATEEGNLGTTASLTVPMPATAAGDVLVASVGVLGNGTVAPPTVTTPGGWSVVRDTVQGAALRQVTFIRTAAAGEAANVTYTLSAVAHAQGTVVAYRGANVTSRIDVEGENRGASGTAAGTPYALESGVMQVQTASFATATTANADAALTERVQGTSSGVPLGTGVTVGTADHVSTGTGALPARSATPGDGSKAWIAHSVGLRDAARATLSVGPYNSPALPTPAFTATLNGTDRTPTFTLPLALLDSRNGTGGGWNLTASATPFTTGTRTLPAGALAVTGVSTSKWSLGQVSSPATSPTPTGVTWPIGVTNSAVKVYNAAAGTGIGYLIVQPAFRVTVPANAYAGSYSSTLTVTVANGP